MKKIKPYSFYYGVAILLLLVGLVAQMAHISVALVLGMFAILCSLYGLELQKALEDQSNTRKIALWLVALTISALLLGPLYA